MSKMVKVIGGIFKLITPIAKSHAQHQVRLTAHAEGRRFTFAKLARKVSVGNVESVSLIGKSIDAGILLSELQSLPFPVKNRVPVRFCAQS